MFTQLQRRIFTSIFLVLTLFLLLIASVLVFKIVIGAIIIYGMIMELPRLVPYKYDDVRFWLFLPTYSYLSAFSVQYVLRTTPAFSLFSVNVSPLYIFAAAWLCDTAAYIVGSVFGRHKMAPKISPKKTWEGFIGAMIMSISFHLWLNTQVGLFSSIYSVITYALGVCIAATLGDVYISYLKRKSGVKDTGSILPGHGGILDRFDSVIGVAIYVALFFSAPSIFF